MSDEKDFLERTADYWRNRGLDWSPESTVENFGLHGPRKRAEALDQLDTELANFEPTTENMRKGAEMLGLRRNLREVHHNLLKVSR